MSDELASDTPGNYIVLRVHGVEVSNKTLEEVLKGVAVRMNWTSEQLTDAVRYARMTLL